MDTTHDGHGHSESALRALRGSVDRLHQLARGLDDEQLELQSYCTEWSIADALSHVGSGAVIWRRQLEDVLAGRDTPEGFAPSVWEQWNAKVPREKADDALVADEALLERLEGLGEDERAGLVLPMGPMRFSFGEAVAMRLNEHALHTWDVEVVFDESAHLPEDAAAVVVDNLGLIARYTGRPPGAERSVTVRTTHPAREFALHLRSGGVELEPATATATATAEPDLELPAEAFCRLVYGRLDADHTPPVGTGSDMVDLLRQVFPGP